MSAESFKVFINRFAFLKRRIKNTGLYYSFRNFLYKKEQKRERRIEAKYGLEGMIKYTKKWYKTATGYELDLDNPKTFTDKQQWLKFYDQSPLKVQCSDKYAVREYISKKVGQEYLVPLISIDSKDRFYNANDIDFSKLPNSFVLSCNHGSSMTIVVKDKTKLKKKNIKSIKKRLNQWLKTDVSYVNAFDFTYKGIKPCIIITEYLTNGNDDLKDFKVFCFNGKPKYLWVDSGRFGDHRRTVYDRRFNKMPFRYGVFKEENNSKPVNFEKMFELSEILSKDFKLVRVDFYEVNGVLKIGELTFNSGAGRDLIYPNEYNEKLGEELSIK